MKTRPIRIGALERTGEPDTAGPEDLRPPFHDDTAALPELLEDRRAGRFISLAEGRKRMARVIARKRAAHGLSDGTAGADA